ncbi:MAG: type II toxin-antitoxin system VapC family toxin [Deltaproteobacteria bacterium]|nr:type II toxin-antitoxin system VapC family toxin [Deltaproteobacteria bacterium]
MPSKTVEFAVLDTSVYIENFRTGRFTQRIMESSFLFRGVSVVVHELLRGARRPEERDFALELATNLRMYTPTERIWLDSGTIVAHLAAAKGYERRKIQEISFDVLIALTARSIGATVITTNRQDFEDIQRYRQFHFLCWE